VRTIEKMKSNIVDFVEKAKKVKSIQENRKE
jgi:hypothetical protein